MKKINFFDGAESSSEPTVGNIAASSLLTYPDDAAYEAANGPGTAGSLYYNTTDHVKRYYDANASAWKNDIKEPIDATLIGDGSVDNTEFGYLEGATSNLQSQIDTNYDAFYNHVYVDAEAHQAEKIINVPSGNLTSTTQQDVNNELQSDIDTRALDSDLQDHITDIAGAHAASAISNIPSGNLTSDNQQDVNDELQADIDTRLPAVEKGAANGVAPLDSNSKVPSAYLPSFVDDVLEYADYASLPVTGETGKIYITLDDNLQYRWTGSVYVQITASPGTTDDVPEGTLNLYFTDARARTAVVDDAIVDGVTNKAPSQNAVFDALAGKQVTGNYIESLTGDVTASGPGAAAATIANDAVSNAKAANMAAWKIKMRNDSASGDPQDQSVGDLTELTTPVPGDFVLGQLSTGELRKINVGNISGGGSGKNIIPTVSSTFEATIGGWSTYADAAGTQPVDGIGGSPNITVSRTTTSSEVLNGLASLKIAKDAANRQGQGASLTVDVPNYIRGLPCKLSMSLKGSANFDFGTPFDITDPSDIVLYLYDVTNSRLLQPYPYTVFSNGVFEGLFQIPSDCAQIRVILHIATTNASAWDLFVDDVILGEALNTEVDDDSDWESYTPTFTGFGTPTNVQCQFKKDGDDVLLRLKWTSGTVTATEARVSLPAGLISADTTKIASIQTCGDGSESDFQAAIEPSTAYIVFTNYAGGAGLTKQNASAVFSSSTAVSVTARVPIQGFTSGRTTSASANLNAPAVLRTYKNAGSITANTTIPSWTAEDADSNLAFDASTGVYTVKTPGDYQINASLEVTVTSTSSLQIRKNGTVVSQSSAGVTSTRKQLSDMLPGLKVGDTITLTSDTSETVASNNTGTFLTIVKQELNGRVYATRIAMIKDVKANNTAGGTFTSGSYQTRTLNTLSGDTSFVSLASNQFTLQPGRYKIDISAPGKQVGLHKCKLRNITDSTDTIIGQNAKCESSAGSGNMDGITHSRAVDIIDITAAKTFEVQHRCAITLATIGFGEATNFGDNEVYTVVQIEKIL